MEKQLEYIQAVAQYGSIQKAAEKLYITSSALSKYVQKQEKELGFQLFDRIGKRFILTYGGERYLSWLMEIGSVRGQMESEMHDISTAQRGTIRVGIQLNATDAMARHILPRFYQEFPLVAVELNEDSSTHLCALLNDNFLDFAIVPDMNLGSDITTIKLAELHKIVVTPQNHPCVLQAVPKDGFPYPWIDFSLLKNERFLFPSRNADPFGVITNALRDYGFKPNIVRQTTHFSLPILQCISNGIGISICSDRFVKSYADELSLAMLSFGNDSFYHDYVIAYHKNHYIDKAAAKFLELCQAYYK